MERGNGALNQGGCIKLKQKAPTTWPGLCYLCRLSFTVTQGNFDYILDISAQPSGAIPVSLIATDAEGNTTTRNLTLYRDTEAPIITLASGIALAPTVNPVVETPYPLTGSVTDTELAGLSINGQSVGLLPGTEPDSYDFEAALELPPGIDTPVSVEAWDQAGNRSSRELLFNADISTGIEIITPLEGAELIATGATHNLEIVARLTGLSATDSVMVSADGGTAAAMTLNGATANATLVVTATDGNHELLVQVKNDRNEVTAQARARFTLTNSDNIELALSHTEPANLAQNIEPNAFIALYFNKAIDPALLSISVKETAHGETYDLSGQNGANPITEGNRFKIVKVDYDQQPLPFGQTRFPGNRTLAIYPARDFVYSAQVFVDVSYNGAELKRFSFSVRPLPTLLQGFVADTLRQPLAGIEVTLPDLNQSTTTNSEGSFSFGFGDATDNALPGGRHRIIINPHLKDPTHGSIETWANLEAGRFTQLELTTIPILNAAVPYRRIKSGQKPAILAAGDLTLDLSQAELLFADGRNYGDVHVQLLQRNLIPYRAQPSVSPHWLFAVQPANVQVSGSMKATLAMPALYGSYNYLPDDGALVLMIGFDPKTKQLSPIGIGRVERTQRRVVTVGSLQPTSLGYIGYALKDEAVQTVMRQYEAGQISFTQLIVTPGQTHEI